MIISENESLTNLRGLEALEHVGWALAIMKNARLNQLEALDNLSEIRHSLMVVDNEALPHSAIDDFLARLVEAGFTGDVEVAGNLTP